MFNSALQCTAAKNWVSDSY